MSRTPAPGESSSCAHAQRPQVGLWLLLIVLPLAALVTGGATLLLRWNDDAALRAAAESALAAGGILAIVAMHALSD